VPQVEDPDRVRGGWRLLSDHPETDLLVLDDGFQHRRLARNADVVLLDATDPFGGGRMLPRGRLREPTDALSRASAVVVTRAERVDAATRAALVREVRRHVRSAVVAVARTVPRALILAGGEERPIDELRGRNVFAVAAIGNPAAFEASLADAGARVVGRVYDRDHAVATRSDAARVAALARAARADRVVVTRKDLVKWRTLPVLPDGLCALDVGFEVVEGETDLLLASLPPRARS
jgi:tetraacyldisaccharide 4'-kinase